MYGPSLSTAAIGRASGGRGHGRPRRRAVMRGRTTAIQSVAAALCLIGLLTSPPAAARDTNGIVVYETDFGLKDGAVSAMRGVALSVDPTLRLEDLTHEIPAFNIWEGAYRLNATAPYWAAGTVFVSVIDPGVGR